MVRRAGALAVRLAQSVAVLWAAFTVVFLILHVLPGDPVSIMLSQSEDGLSADPAQVAALRARYGLDRPLPVQYGIALYRALHLDFGQSIQTGQPVLATLRDVLPGTAALASVAFALALLVGIALAVATHHAPEGATKAALAALPALGTALPTFWVGLLLLQVFSFHWPLFPAMGNDGWRALALPAATLAIPTSARIAQIAGRTLADAAAQPFATAVAARGVGRARLMAVHLLPNVAISLVTMSGLIAGNLLAGSVVTETVFSRDGIGRLAQLAVQTKDIPVVEGVVLLAASLFVAINLAVDLLYPLLDPRIGK
ncbi:peptide ABC transporter permease [Acetobacter sp. DsW_063]|nr:peptide ABC transporter permease [Acetobacter sp. DsW_063]